MGGDEVDGAAELALVLALGSTGCCFAGASRGSLRRATGLCAHKESWAIDVQV